MSEARGFVKNVAWMLVFNVAPSIFALVVMMVAARIVIPDQMNDYQVAIGFSSMAILFGDLGIGSVVARHIAVKHDVVKEYYGPYLTFRMAFLVVLYAAMMVVAYILYGSNTNVIELIAFAGVGQVLAQLGSCFITYFQGMEKLEYAGIGTLIRSFVYFVSGWLLAEYFKAWGLVAAGVLSNAVALIIFFVYFRDMILTEDFELSIGNTVQVWISLLKESVPFMGGAVLGTFGLYADRVILSITRYSDVAYYSLPLSIVYSLNFFAMSYAMVAYPFICRMLDSANIQEIYEKSFRYLTAIVAPTSVGIFLLSPSIIPMVYGPSYSSSIDVLRVLSIMLFFYSMAIVMSVMLQAQHKEKLVLYGQIGCIVVNVVLNIVLSTWMGALGTAIACMLTIGVFNFGVSLYLMREELENIGLKRTAKCTGGACIAMAVSILLVPMGNTFAYILLGIVVYSIAFYLLGGVDQSDWDLLDRVLKRESIA